MLIYADSGRNREKYLLSLSPVQGFSTAFIPSPAEEQKLSTETSPCLGDTQSTLIRFNTLSHLRKCNQFCICIALANELHCLLKLGFALMSFLMSPCRASKLSQRCSMLSSTMYLHLIMNLARRLQCWWLAGSHSLLFWDAEFGAVQDLVLAKCLSWIYR